MHSSDFAHFYLDVVEFSFIFFSFSQLTVNPMSPYVSGANGMGTGTVQNYQRTQSNLQKHIPTPQFAFKPSTHTHQPLLNLKCCDDVK